MKRLACGGIHEVGLASIRNASWNVALTARGIPSLLSRVTA